MMATAEAIFEALAESRTVEPGIMIVVAHPDDETIGMGAQLCRFGDAVLVQVTDGAPRDGCDASARGHPTIADYAAARRAELAAALDAGQAQGITTEVIGIADQEACLNLVVLSDWIAWRLRAERPEAVFVQPYEGGHPGHDAASFAVNVACRLIEGEGRSVPAIIEMTAYHAQGTGLETGLFLPAQRHVTTMELTPARAHAKTVG